MSGAGDRFSNRSCGLTRCSERRDSRQSPPHPRHPPSRPSQAPPQLRQVHSRWRRAGPRTSHPPSRCRGPAAGGVAPPGLPHLPPDTPHLHSERSRTHSGTRQPPPRIRAFPAGASELLSLVAQRPSADLVKRHPVNHLRTHLLVRVTAEAPEVAAQGPEVGDEGVWDGPAWAGSVVRRQRSGFDVVRARDRCARVTSPLGSLRNEPQRARLTQSVFTAISTATWEVPLKEQQVASDSTRALSRSSPTRLCRSKPVLA